jgi:glycolate dehydrogenase FAD-binding subunit
MNQLDPAVLARELGAIVGDANVRAPSAHEARAASVIAEPCDAGAVAELVRKCEADALALAPIGGARTLAQMRPAPVAAGVSLARMNRVIAYEPDDMTIIAEAGITLEALNALTASRGQRLPADPPNPARTTLGAMVAAAHAGPIRLSEGTVRDLLIGVRFAAHGARMIHGGGQVVKNVAGYDLMKVMVGSFGTLGIVTETTFRVRPIPQRYTLAAAEFPDPAAALDAAAALHDAVPLIHLEAVSAAVAESLGYESRPQVLAGCGGSAQEVEYLIGQARAILGPATRVCIDAEAATSYRRLRDFEADNAANAAVVAQIAVAPAELAPCLSRCGAEFRAHVGSGVAQVFIREAANDDELERTLARWREVARRARGNLRVLRINPGLRGRVNIFDDPPPPALALMRRLKATFDPHGVFNPGCFVGGI